MNSNHNSFDKEKKETDGMTKVKESEQSQYFTCNSGSIENNKYKNGNNTSNNNNNMKKNKNRYGLHTLSQQSTTLYTSSSAPPTVGLTTKRSAEEQADHYHQSHHHLHRKQSKFDHNFDRDLTPECSVDQPDEEEQAAPKEVVEKGAGKEVEVEVEEEEDGEAKLSASCSSISLTSDASGSTSPSEPSPTLSTTPSPSLAHRQKHFEAEMPDWKNNPKAWAFLQSLHPSYESAYLTRQTADGNSSTGYVFGRLPECDFTFTKSEISKRHCVIHMESGCDSNNESGISIYLKDISSNGTYVNGSRVKPGSRVLLQTGDRIQLYRRDCYAEDDLRHLFYRILLPPNFEVVEFHSLYRVGKSLGKGNFATVYQAFDRTEPTQGSQPRYVAVKSIKKLKLERKPRLLPSIIQEIGILMSLKAHPFVIQIEKVFDEARYIYLVLEYVSGGDLFDLVSKNVCLTEKQTRFIFFQLFSGIKFLHDRNVIHRDLKPENVLVVDQAKLQIKITDFGLAKMTTAAQQMLDSQCGTPNYVAPEILDPAGLRSYGRECDLWSLGVILYICLCGFPPFNEEMGPPSMRQQIRGGIYSFLPKYWDKICDEAKDLVQELLTVDPKARITVDEAREHAFMTMDIETLRSQVQELPDHDLEILQQYEFGPSFTATQLMNTQPMSSTQPASF